jgi:hypothetical protein
LFLIVEVLEGAYPIAKMPIVPFPVADPALEETVEDVAVVFTHPANVYLFFILLVPPNANIANVPVGYDQFPAATACICWFNGQTPEYGATAPVFKALTMLPI